MLASETNPIMSQAQGAAAVLANSSTHSGIGLNDAGSDGTFPGVGAGREALMKYFLSKSGVKFLQQPEYKAAYALYVNNGVLAKILHRYCTAYSLNLVSNMLLCSILGSLLTVILSPQLPFTMYVASQSTIVF